MVSHLKRPDGKGHEEGAVSSLSQLRGSASIAQLSDMVIGLERNGQADDPVERNRWVANPCQGAEESLLWHYRQGRWVAI